ncbi:HAD family hydrolase [Lysobacter arvi]|uniref:HAD-IA family hydrolase n=1 Tax=Lysobacter arvi TaxID=3038776 RepID=A0ABU1CAK8_9GAMM|nr:HAD-IA family hydrolase [Lysobacter arvi]MDR0182234.1 HAD-IA family hydrolase [Lysobacter arvi]
MSHDVTLLFDLDGTLVNTDELHFDAFRTLLADFGRSLSMETYRSRIMGGSNEAIMHELFPDEPADVQRQLAERKEALFRSAVTTLEPTRGLIELLDWAGRHGIRIGVVTNAPRPNAELMLGGIGIADRIDALVIGEELARGKPDPLPYLTGLERLGGDAARAFAFEDSLSGIRSASAAGIHTFGLRGALAESALRDAGANEVIDDFLSPVLWRRLERIEAEGPTRAGRSGATR